MKGYIDFRGGFLHPNLSWGHLEFKGYPLSAPLRTLGFISHWELFAFHKLLIGSRSGGVSFISLRVLQVTVRESLIHCTLLALWDLIPRQGGGGHILIQSQLWTRRHMKHGGRTWAIVYVELCALHITVHEEVRIERFVIERYRLESLDTSPHSDPVTLIVCEVQGPQPVVWDASEDSLCQS